MKSKIPLLPFQNFLLSFCLFIAKFFFWSINVFLFHYKNYLHISKNIISNDIYHFQEFTICQVLYLSTLLYSLFTVKVGTLIISQFHILKK